jgi:hypothetical protein
MSPAENTAAKARRLAATPGAVTIVHQSPDGIVATVTGDHGTYRVVLDDTGGWCSCPARQGCAHLGALQSVAGDPPDFTREDPGPAGEPAEVIDPATPEPEPAPTRGALAIRGGDPAALDLGTAAVTFQTLKVLAATEFVPAGLRNRPAAVLGAVLLGRDYGLGPLEALRLVDVIDGSPAPSAELWLRLYRQAGHRLSIEQADDQACILIGERGDTGEKLKVSFTLADAERAGLLTLDPDGRPIARSKAGKAMPWQTFTADLLWARAVSRLVRRLAPDALGQGHRPTAEGVAG